MDAIEQQAQHLNEMIGRLRGSDVAADVPAAKGWRLDLVALAREQVDARRAVTPGRHLRLAIDPAELWIDADRTAMAQVLDNLIGNALRHAPDGPVDVEVSGAENLAVVRVCDRGPGLPSADPELVFERGRSYGQAAGLGLGLYISRRIADLHGGRLEAANRPGGGACFTLALPWSGSTSSDPDH